MLPLSKEIKGWAFKATAPIFSLSTYRTTGCCTDSYQRIMVFAPTLLFNFFVFYLKWSLPTPYPLLHKLHRTLFPECLAGEWPAHLEQKVDSFNSQFEPTVIRKASLKWNDFIMHPKGKSQCLDSDHLPFGILPCTTWRRKWQPTPVFLLGESQGQRSLVRYSPWGRKSRTRLSD